MTVLASGDTHVSAEDMTRLSENSNLLALGVAPLQLIYATLSTISEQADLSCVEEGRSSLLTIELIGGIQTAVLSSVQEASSIIHSITYHFPLASNNVNIPEIIKDQESSTAVDPKTLEALPQDWGGSKTPPLADPALGTSLFGSRGTTPSMSNILTVEKTDNIVEEDANPSTIVTAAVPTSSFGNKIIPESREVQKTDNKDTIQKSDQFQERETIFFINNPKGLEGKDFNDMKVSKGHHHHHPPSTDVSDGANKETVMMIDANCRFVQVREVAKPDKEIPVLQNIPPSVIVSEHDDNIAMINTSNSNIHLVPTFSMKNQQSQSPTTYISHGHCVTSL